MVMSTHSRLENSRNFIVFPSLSDSRESEEYGPVNRRRRESVVSITKKRVGDPEPRGSRVQKPESVLMW